MNRFRKKGLFRYNGGLQVDISGEAQKAFTQKELPALKAEEVPPRREPGPKPKGEKITRVSVKEKSRPATDQTAQ
jgi:hypothetical protein